MELKKNIKNTTGIKLFSDIFLLNKFLNNVFKNGKKLKVKKILINSFLKVQLIFKCNFFVLLSSVFKKICPFFEVIKSDSKSFKFEYTKLIGKSRQNYLMFKWFFDSLKINKNIYRLEDKIIYEFFNILKKNKSYALEKKKNTFSDFKKNKTLIHYRWKKFR